MSLDVLNKMQNLMKGCLIFIALDSSPTKDRRTFIIRRFTFVDQKGEFHSLNFGVLNVEGILSGAQYSDHLQRFVNVFEIDHLSIENNLINLFNHQDRTFVWKKEVSLSPLDVALRTGKTI